MKTAQPDYDVTWAQLFAEEPDDATDQDVSDGPSTSDDRGHDDDEGHAKKKGPSQSTQMVDLAVRSGATFWHTRDGESWATVPVGNHFEHHRIHSKEFGSWLRGEYYRQKATAPGTQAVQDALNTLDAEAVFAGPVHDVFVRVAGHEDRVFIDLGTADRTVVEVSSTGWRMVAEAPVRFRRPRQLRPMPLPESDGSLDDLRSVINVGSDTDLRLVGSWLVTALYPTGPYPVLPLSGEQGSAKSTTARVLKRIIDPSEVDLRTQPRNEQDMFIAASNSWIVALDNLSSVAVWMSDTICRLATGAGFAARKLYTDGEEAVFEAQRPVLLNGIGNLGARSDLLDRSMPMLLPVIREECRRTEAEIWSRFELVAPQILGLLLNGLVTVLREAGNVQLDRLPRMADFAVRAVAAAPVLGWTGDEFLKAYESNRSAANEVAIDESPVAALIIKIVDECGTKQWRGNSAALLNAIQAIAPEQSVKAREWPRSPRELSDHLRRISPNLRAAGVEVEQFKKNREWQLERVPGSASPASPASPADSRPGDDVTARVTHEHPGEAPSSPSFRFESDAGDAGNGQLEPSSNQRYRVAL